MTFGELLIIIYVFVLAIFVGFEVYEKNREFHKEIVFKTNLRLPDGHVPALANPGIISRLFS